MVVSTIGFRWPLSLELSILYAFCDDVRKSSLIDARDAADHIREQGRPDGVS